MQRLLIPLAICTLWGSGCRFRPDDGGRDTTGETIPEPTGTPLPAGPDDLSPAEQAALANEPPTPPALADTPSAIGHFKVARQASSYLAGPQSPNAVVEVMDLTSTMGVNVGVSPWHVTGPRIYSDSDGAAIWGATLTHLYKIAIDESGFRFVDLFRINALPTSIPWNHGALANGRVIVPDQNGYFGKEDADRCGTLDPSFLLFGDDPRSLDSDLRCEAALELGAGRLRDACGVEPTVPLNRGRTAISLTASFAGPLGTLAVFGDAKAPQSYLVLFDSETGEIDSCAFVDDSFATNEIAAEPLGENNTAFYVPTEDSIVKMVHEASGSKLVRRWERQVPVRERTGTTPTLVDTPDGESFVVTVDGRCATISVINGLIGCAEDTSNSRLVAVRRGDDVPAKDQVLLADLPPWLATTENSPASRNGYVVVANYSGYLPNGLVIPAGAPLPEGQPADWLVSPDAVADYATGMAVMRWNPESGEFEIAWSVADRQIGGVPTISEGANLVYGTGSERETERTYLYGFLLEDDARGPAGTEVLRIDLGEAPFRESTTDLQGNVIIPIGDYGFQPGELYDAGNMIMINHDRSLILSMGSAVVRVSEP